MSTSGFMDSVIGKIGLFSDDERSALIKKNIFFSFLIKGFSITVSLLLVPLTLHYLSVYEFGVWLTLSSLFTWINYFDIGLGNGLRNRLTEAIAERDNELGQIFVSTTFFLLSLIITFVFFVFLVLQPYINWSEILNVDPVKVADLNKVIILSFAFFCINFLFKIVGIVYAAAQKPAINDFLTLSGSLLSLIVIFLLTKTTTGTLINVAFVFSAAPTIVFLIAYPITFYGNFRDFKPRISSIKPYYAKDLMNLGLQFFILQITSLLIFGTSNIIISKILGPEEVTPYNIAFKYFGIATMIFNIIQAPMWSASTDAYAKNDLQWIKRNMKGMMKISLIGSAGVLLLVILGDAVYRSWVGSVVTIPFKLTVWMGMYTIVLLWSTCFSTFLFGIGKLRAQLINTIAVSILFIPLAVWLSKSLGITGIAISLCLVNLSGAILNPVQYFKIVSGTARGVWNQ